MYRDHRCNDICKADEGRKVVLAGWVHRRRDHGGLIFIDLRDRFGITQIVTDPEHSAEAHFVIQSVRSEFVIQITGIVRSRPEGMSNMEYATGEVEVLVDEVTILNASKTPPFEIDMDKDINEEVRLKYRYLDLRRMRMKKNIVLRHRVIKTIRDFFDTEDFIEIETPILIKGTPEGSREYIVPSRLYVGKFYVLPQSPQQLKQLLMVAGMDRYFQVARCFRDEDQRGDRQPEFTQLDIEMSFITSAEIMSINEKLLIRLIETFQPGKKLLCKPFPHLTWLEAMTTYGSDKPDLRFDLRIKPVTDLVRHCGFQVFSDAAQMKDFVVHALCVPGGAQFSRKEIDELTEIAKIYDAKGLAYIVVEKAENRSPIIKFLGEELTHTLLDEVGAKPGDIVFFMADSFRTSCEALGAVRLRCADKLGLRHPDEIACCWVVDFPLFEWSKEHQCITASHHPFTSPLLEDVHLLQSDPLRVRSQAYDIVMNGNEIGGGSIRIHDRELQSMVFDVLGISIEDVKHRFGHMLEAFEYGAPPHGGIAWGLDRLIMIFANEPNIREVIAFPKDSKAKDLMLNAPSSLPDEQIVETHVKVIDE